MVRTRTVVRAAVTLVVVAAVGLAVLPLSLALDEMAMPPASSLPALPDGARVTAEGMGCGSGGCWVELTVDAPAGMSGEELAAAVTPGRSECAFQSLLDLRRVCASAMDVEAGSAQFSVQYDRWVD
ncbi:hypothetical protein APR04_000123 [Promicromonospora umidemergens]|uniref:Uncharacterized protein n=1 Tax=Promicromonospora umidemergens TaxID=629679 RepID=A0ABP8X6T9_9MICO|nr:hypothetical protein [Promicromonospora umidemergens]MCP2281234.1 hypothetical protein [Promicromonospora umidemergens]